MNTSTATEPMATAIPQDHMTRPVADERPEAALEQAAMGIRDYHNGKVIGSAEHPSMEDASNLVHRAQELETVDRHFAVAVQHSQFSQIAERPQVFADLIRKIVPEPEKQRLYLDRMEQQAAHLLRDEQLAVVTSGIAALKKELLGE